MVGSDGKTLTAVSLAPLMVPGLKRELQARHPKLSLTKVKAAVVEAKVDEPQPAAAEVHAEPCSASDVDSSSSSESGSGDECELVPGDVTQWRGWRTSYRKSCPEDYNKQEPKVRRVLSYKLKHLGNIRARLDAGASRRHRVVRPRDMAKKRQRQKAVKAALAARRKK